MVYPIYFNSWEDEVLAIGPVMLRLENERPGELLAVEFALVLCGDSGEKVPALGELLASAIANPELPVAKRRKSVPDPEVERP